MAKVKRGKGGRFVKKKRRSRRIANPRGPVVTRRDVKRRKKRRTVKRRSGGSAVAKRKATRRRRSTGRVSVKSVVKTSAIGAGGFMLNGFLVPKIQQRFTALAGDKGRLVTEAGLAFLVSKFGAKAIGRTNANALLGGMVTALVLDAVSVATNGKVGLSGGMGTLTNADAIALTGYGLGELNAMTDEEFGETLRGAHAEMGALIDLRRAA